MVLSLVPCVKSYSQSKSRVSETGINCPWIWFKIPWWVRDDFFYHIAESRKKKKAGPRCSMINNSIMSSRKDLTPLFPLFLCWAALSSCFLCAGCYSNSWVTSGSGNVHRQKINYLFQRYFLKSKENFRRSPVKTWLASWPHGPLSPKPVTDGVMRSQV